MTFMDSMGIGHTSNTSAFQRFNVDIGRLIFVAGHFSNIWIGHARNMNADKLLYAKIVNIITLPKP